MYGGVRTIMKAKSKHGHSAQYWHVWLRTRRQRLAAFTTLLMLALGLIIGRPAAIFRVDRDQEHTHVESELMGQTSRASSPGIRADSGATATNVKTGTIGFLAALGQGVNVLTNYDLGSGLL